MFKVSEDIYLAANDSANHSKTYGVYQQSNADQDTYGHTVQTFVDPGVTEVEKITVLHWPVEENITQNKPVEFVIRKNGARGNVQVKLVNVKNQSKDLPLVSLDPDRYLCKFTPESLGVQKVRVYFNTVEIPCSPLPLYVRADQPPALNLLPEFHSDVSAVQCSGAGITSAIISLHRRNEFIVDASRAGNNILFVAVYGPSGQCDNLAIKHKGDNVYLISYALHDAGQYLIIVKWGNESVPGSPFQFTV